jgi:hypothetical protein
MRQALRPARRALRIEIVAVEVPHFPSIGTQLRIGREADPVED